MITRRPFSALSAEEINRAFLHEFAVLRGRTPQKSLGTAREATKSAKRKRKSPSASVSREKAKANAAKRKAAASKKKKGKGGRGAESDIESFELGPPCAALAKLLPRGLKPYHIEIEHQTRHCTCNGCLGYKSNGWLHYLALSADLKPNQGGRLKKNILKTIRVIDETSDSWCDYSKESAESAKEALNKITSKSFGYRSENGSNVRAFSVGVVRKELGHLLVLNQILDPLDKTIEENTRQIFYDVAAEFKRRKAKWRPKPLRDYLAKYYETPFKEGKIDKLTWDELNKSLFSNLRVGSLPHILAVRSLFEGRCNGQEGTRDFGYLVEEAYPHIPKRS